MNPEQFLKIQKGYYIADLKERGYTYKAIGKKLGGLGVARTRMLHIRHLCENHRFMKTTMAVKHYLISIAEIK